jgi:catechol 2,3-dioxygenase-like lactoylglutathione lyase family enzyme
VSVALMPERADAAESGIRVRHWSHVIVHVADIDASLAFYRDLLGAEVFTDETIDGPGFEEMTGIEGASARIINLVLGGQKVELIALTGVPSGPPAQRVGRGLAGFAVRVDDLDAALAACRAASYDCADPTEISGFRQFMVVDPDGVHVEISQPPDGLERFGPFSGR